MLSPVDEIKSRLDIVEVIQGYLRLNKAGTNWKGICPFHSEKTPSFMVSQSKQMWHCFGCSQGGDIFSFVSKMEGGEFTDALRLLADKAGVKLSRQDPQVQSQKKGGYEICELATKFFERQLASKTGQAAVAYLENRGVHKKTIDYFRLGWAPDSWQSLRDFLRGEGFKDSDIETAGLVVRSEKSSPGRGQEFHDRFRHRIMFPICDTQDQVVGFSGRLFDKVPGKTVHADAGKYINTPNTLLYDKSRALYGLEKAKVPIREAGAAILVEGNLDVIMSHQAGVKNAVAPCGTAFTLDHLKTLKRYGEKILLAFDDDAAGEAALKKGVTIALANGISVMVVAMPLGKDTADVVKEKPELWLEAVAKPVPYMEFILNKTLSHFPAGSLESKKAVLANVLPFVKSISSPLDRDYWLGELSHKIKVDKSVLASELRLVKTDEIYTPQPEPPKGSSGLKLRQEEYLIALLLKYPHLKKLLGEEELELLAQPELALVARSLVSGEEPKELDSSVVLASELIVDLVTEPEAEFLKILKSLKHQNLQHKLKLIEADVKEAERAGDATNLELLLKEFNDLSKKLNEN